MPAFIAVLLLTLLVGDIAWWRWARRLMRLESPWVRRVVDGLFVAMVVSLVLVAASRLIDRRIIERLPVFVFSATLLWHLIGLPVSLLIGLARRGGQSVRDRTAKPRAAGVDLDRRAFLSRAAAAAPMIVVGASIVRSQQTVNDFAVRAIDLPIRDLPSGLDGLSIAHVSDTHLGRLTDASVFGRVVRATNALDADLVLHTGDLINDDQRDLPTAAEFLRHFRSRFGTFICEGNHDIIGGRENFERFMRAEKLPLILDEVARLRINGVDIDLLGVPWTRPGYPTIEASIAGAVDRVATHRTPGAFGILLAHHPHALDTAAVHGIPLMLSGHTHGGQLNLTKTIGFGPAIYRYWSGTYQVGDSTGVVSNGAGNWFPLRVNAPAEIVRLTLRRA